MVMAARQPRIEGEQVLSDGVAVDVKVAAYSMSVNDTVVHCDTSSGGFTVTLPSVAESKGRVYTVKLDAGAGAGAAPNAVTVSDKSNDSSHWDGDVVLRRPNQFVTLVSDGEIWHIVRVHSGAIIAPSKYMHEMFLTPVVAGSKGVAALGAPTGATGAENILLCSSGNYLEYHALGTQTLLGPIWVDPGLNVACDLTDNDGLELSTGIGAGNPRQFVVGTDPAFFARCRFTIADVSGTDDCAFGFRKREAYQANIDDYDEMACLNVISGNITLETILNAAATTATDSTDNWADGETHTLEVKVNASGVVTYLIDDAAPTVTAAFTFDNGEVVIPFFYFLHATTSPGAITILEFECGYQG